MEDAIIDKHFILDEFVRDGRSGSSASFHLAPVGKCFVERGSLSRIEEASGYSFFYDENKIDLSRQVSVNAQNKAVKDVLKNILFSTGMTFEISNNQIVLVPEKKAAAKEVSVAVVQQQTHIVKGIVVDNLGEPVPGANVVEKGTTNGIITDMDGAFSLTVAPDAVLEISYIGYVTQSVSVKGKSTLNITLREDSQALEEVVVTGFRSVAEKGRR